MGKLMNKIAYGDRMEWLFYAGVLVALLPVIIFRDFTPDNELRYLSITDEAIRNHDIFAFYNHGAPYADKPPLYFCFTMACRLIAGRHCMWLLALGSVLRLSASSLSCADGRSIIWICAHRAPQ